MFVTVLLLSQPVCAGNDWKRVSGNVDMKTGNALSCGDYTIKLVDFSAADKTALFEIASASGKKEIAIVAAGNSYLFGDDNYKATFVNYKNKKINIAVYARLRPVFRTETETRKSHSISYTHITTAVFECKEKTASGVVIEFECENVKLNGKLNNVKIGTCAVGAKSKVTIKYTPVENASIVAKITYKDAAGKEYKQCIDVIKNISIVEESKEVAATENTVVVRKTSNEDRAKRVFIKAIDTAIARITFTVEQKDQLLNIKKTLEDSLN